MANRKLQLFSKQCSNNSWRGFVGNFVIKLVYKFWISSHVIAHCHAMILNIHEIKRFETSFQCLENTWFLQCPTIYDNKYLVWLDPFTQEQNMKDLHRFLQILWKVSTNLHKNKEKLTLTQYTV